jgi:hypothetical protein
MVAFFFACVSRGQKKVGVPADLVLVSTYEGRCEGWRSRPRAIRNDSRAILWLYLDLWCDQLHSSIGGIEKGAIRRP